MTRKTKKRSGQENGAIGRVQICQRIPTVEIHVCKISDFRSLPALSQPRPCPHPYYLSLPRPSPYITTDYKQSMAPKAKANGSANGAVAKAKPAKAPTPSPSASGTATPLPSEDVKSGSAQRTGRPDKAAYDVEQERLKKEIAELQEKMVSGNVIATNLFNSSIHSILRL